MAIYSRFFQLQCVFAHPKSSPTFNLYFNILSQMTVPLCIHIKNGLFYQVLLHFHWDSNLHFMSQFM